MPQTATDTTFTDAMIKALDDDDGPLVNLHGRRELSADQARRIARLLECVQQIPRTCDVLRRCNVLLTELGVTYDAHPHGQTIARLRHDIANALTLDVLVKPDL
jgi:hypothetical protein